MRLITKSWQPHACLNSQNYHPQHGTPNFMAFPTYKLGCDWRYIPMASMINSTSCQSTLSSTSPWHTTNWIDFRFWGHLLMLLVSSSQLPALSQISWFSARKLPLCPDRRGDKGRVRETAGRQRDTSLANKVALTNERAQTVWDVGTVIAKDI